MINDHSELAQWHYHISHYIPIEAALISVGIPPSRLNIVKYTKSEQLEPNSLHAKCRLYYLRIKQAILDKKLPTDYNPIHQPNIDNALIHKDDLVKWLKKEKIRNYFTDYEPDKIDFDPSVNTPEHPYFSPKLYAANMAWQAITRQFDTTNPNQPKGYIKRYLEDKKYFTHLDPKHLSLIGKATTIDKIAEVANWHYTGGANTSSTPKKPKI